MFDNLTARLSRTLERLRGRGRITEENIGEALREVRMALLEADVALPVVKSFIEAVKAKALGAEVPASLTPGQAFIGILHRELVRAHGRRRAPASTCARSRRSSCCWRACRARARPPPRPSWRAGCIEREQKRVLLVSTDVRRPAAMLQLERLAEQVGAEYFPGRAQQTARRTSRARRWSAPGAACSTC